MEKIKTANVLKNTSFGEIGKRDMFVLRVYMENIIEHLEKMHRKIKSIMENWCEMGTAEELEDLLWDICIFFNGDCTFCPMYFCIKNKRVKKEGEQ